MQMLCYNNKKNTIYSIFMADTKKFLMQSIIWKPERREVILCLK